ncbi:MULTISPECIES: FAD:protein FMN transferase [Burkholderiales]|jgi:thiamine biosynthesis lipoprotein|uniref:FAD:protein FMN transferase n=4 Tax=Betaproteobacteria TaxID=28216 RepID=A0A5B8RSM4_9BURK|nr:MULTISPECIES: FAD:protein FMN transferase [Comamonadaceae]MBS0501978.1 FAD:protein FMN transferase [Pseudomonadota bacterium]QEA11724.1 FAD:protein FMN transferase [Comamonas flocculans]QKD44707.1 FAD:protein FMN transferase [Alicycliphilus denitrificans]
MPKTCSEPLHRLQLHGPTMATRWAVSCDVPPVLDTNALCQALAEAVEQVDAQMSPWQPESALNQLNRAPVGDWLALPAQILEVLARALEVCRLSDGAFDPAVGALVDAWGFGAACDTPDAEAIRAARNAKRLPTPQALELDLAAGLARKHSPLQLDLCGIAKGYAVDRMCAVLTGHGVCHALVALDGELRAIGPQASGAPWAVALESPRAGLRAAHGVIELQDLAVATSGDYRHFVQVGQARLAHSMDGRSGKPVNNGVASVTVLAPRCMDADAWATALLVAGSGQGLALAHRHGLDALWLLRRGEALVELGSGRFAAAASAGTA